MPLKELGSRERFLQWEGGRRRENRKEPGEQRRQEGLLALVLPLACCVNPSRLPSFSGTQFSCPLNRRVGPVSGLQMERDRESYGKKAGLGIEGREGHPASAVNQGSARPASSGAGEGPALLLAPCEHWTLAEQLPSGLGTWCAPGASHLRRQMVADWQAIEWGRVCQKFPRLSSFWKALGSQVPLGFLT